MAGAVADIFISYAWGGESESVAKRVYNVLTANGHRVVMDKKDITYKDNIDAFEKRLGKGDYIVTIISDKYLKSMHCMNEMRCIERQDNVYKRIFPILLADAESIFTPQGRLTYLEFWKDEIVAFRKELEHSGIDSGMEQSTADLTRL